MYKLLFLWSAAILQLGWGNPRQLLDEVSSKKSSQLGNNIEVMNTAVKLLLSLKAEIEEMSTNIMDIQSQVVENKNEINNLKHLKQNQTARLTEQEESIEQLQQELQADCKPHVEEVQEPVACTPSDLPSSELGERLIYSVRQSDTDFLKELLQICGKQEWVDAPDGGSLKTALHRAVGIRNAEAVRLLLPAGAAVDAEDNWQWTPLQEAADNGDTEIAAMLLQAGAAVNHVNKDGNTAAHLAVWSNNLPVLQLLVEHGTDLSLANTYGRTPLQDALHMRRSNIAAWLREQ